MSRPPRVERLFSSALRENFEAYVKLRRALGFALQSQVYILSKFDRVVGREMARRGPMTREVVEAFLRGQGDLTALTRKRQLSDVRQFCLYLRQHEPTSFVPDRDMEPGRGAPRAPHIYTPEEIRALLSGALALDLRPRGALRPQTYHCLFALLYATGLRISEALALDLADADFRQDLLRIRRAKFHKARLVPLAPSAVAGLRRYLELRAGHGFSTRADTPIFVTERGRRIPYTSARGVFIRIARAIGLRGPPGTRGPRIHDMRHTHAIDRLLGWYREGKDVQSLLPVLSTYLGHAKVADTQVYLHTTEEILTPRQRAAPSAVPHRFPAFRRATMNASTPVPSLTKLVQTFFADYLVAQRDLSPHTVLAYRDAMKLYLGFVAGRQKKPVIDLGFDDLSPEGVLAYLEDLEKRRGNSARTRNARLAALHTFFRFVAAREPQLLDLCQRISAIPIKKTAPPVVVYIEHAEFLHVLATVDRRTPIGRRDYLILRLLFDTGARAQEIASVRTPALLLDRPAQVRLLGKGRKERICPLRPETVPLIRDYFRERGVAPGDNMPLIASSRGGPLTRRGILKVVKRHVARAAPAMPSLGKKSVVAHSLRHAAALHLLRAGNDISTVRSWLGHVSVVTTDHYTEIDAEMKRQALEKTEAPAAPKRVPSWRRDKDLLAWLESL